EIYLKIWCLFFLYNWWASGPKIAETARRKTPPSNLNHSQWRRPVEPAGAACCDTAATSAKKVCSRRHSGTAHGKG
ncbi:MAG: hypothetical protein WCD88_14065, partial [Desulfobacterales bacterium]